MQPVNIACIGAIPFCGGALLYLYTGIELFRYIAVFGFGMVVSATIADERDSWVLKREIKLARK